MNHHAIKNIKTLLSINEDTELIFNERKILINNEQNTELVNENNINIHYSIYFTYNQIMNSSNINRNSIDGMNISIDNLYNNIQFQKIIQDDHVLEEIMDDICIKLDNITVKYYNNICNRINQNFYDNIKYFNNKWTELLEIVSKNMPHIIRNTNTENVEISDEEEDEDKGGDEYVKKYN
jgi:hypothetical protein